MCRMRAACRTARVQVRAAGVQSAGRRPPAGGLWPSGETDPSPRRTLTPLSAWERDTGGALRSGTATPRLTRSRRRGRPWPAAAGEDGPVSQHSRGRAASLTRDAEGRITVGSRVSRASTARFPCAAVLRPRCGRTCATKVGSCTAGCSSRVRDRTVLACGCGLNEKKPHDRIRSYAPRSCGTASPRAGARAVGSGVLAKIRFAVARIAPCRSEDV
jgi:hypothetical protein